MDAKLLARLDGLEASAYKTLAWKSSESWDILRILNIVLYTVLDAC